MTDLVKTQDAGFGRLESLSITGFRGIDQLTIPKLGLVTLITGKNGVGKTTVLDAVRIYMAHGRLDALHGVLLRRDELTMDRFDDGVPEKVPALDRLFYRGSKRASIAISPLDGGPVLRVEENVDTEEKAIDVVFDDKRQRHTEGESPLPRSWLPRSKRDSNSSTASIRCALLGPGLLRNNGLARLWDDVALTDNETLARDALCLVFGDRVERTAVIGDASSHGGRRVVVKLSDHANPVPLRSLGDGATRMFGVALALANCRDGILLLDEAENGIHYSLQSKFWGMILRTAKMHNIQILATTHSKDCIDGFAEAASTIPNIDANLVRIGWRKGKLRAVEYPTEELETVAEQNFEVR